ncbi:DUF790 family protein [Candidatus Bathyarchaeota archaeon]|nr:DUF790 family protein [Candidatus Bathyarchaeota archaeon]
MYRRKEVIRPVFVKGDTSLAKTLIAVYGDHVGRRRGALDEALQDCEQLGYDYRLVRGLASVLESRCVFESRASVPPLQARSMVFREAAGRVVATERERMEVLATVAGRLGVSVPELDESLYGDLEDEQVLAEFGEPGAEELLRFYNFANTVALLSYARGIEAAVDGSDDYLIRLAEAVGDVEQRVNGTGPTLVISLKPTNRLHQRASRVDEFLGRLLKAGRWMLKATIVYPARRKQPAVMEMSSGVHGDLLTRDPHGAELIIEIAQREPRKPGHGELIVLEELARRRGVTEAEVIKEIRGEGFEYRDLGGVLVTPVKLAEINEALEGVETLGEARALLKSSGVRNFMPVLEALGYQVEPRRPRDQSRVYRL